MYGLLYLNFQDSKDNLFVRSKEIRICRILSIWLIGMAPYLVINVNQAFTSFDLLGLQSKILKIRKWPGYGLGKLFQYNVSGEVQRELIVLLYVFFRGGGCLVLFLLLCFLVFFLCFCFVIGNKGCIYGRVYTSGVMQVLAKINIMNIVSNMWSDTII